MKKIIKITKEENDKIYSLYSTHISYLNMLEYLINANIQKTEVFDKKWQEAIDIDLQLSKAKRDIEKKYKPSGEWDRFEFDFDNSQVVFIKNDT